MGWENFGVLMESMTAIFWQERFAGIFPVKKRISFFLPYHRILTVPGIRKKYRQLT